MPVCIDRRNLVYGIIENCTQNAEIIAAARE